MLLKLSLTVLYTQKTQESKNIAFISSTIAFCETIVIFFFYARWTHRIASLCWDSREWGRTALSWSSPCRHHPPAYSFWWASCTRADSGTCCQTPTAGPYSSAYRTFPCNGSCRWHSDRTRPRSARTRRDDARPGSTSPASGNRSCPWWRRRRDSAWGTSKRRWTTRSRRRRCWSRNPPARVSRPSGRRDGPLRRTAWCSAKPRPWHTWENRILSVSVTPITSIKIRNCEYFSDLAHRKCQKSCDYCANIPNRMQTF